MSAQGPDWTTQAHVTHRETPTRFGLFEFIEVGPLNGAGTIANGTQQHRMVPPILSQESPHDSCGRVVRASRLELLGFRRGVIRIDSDP